MWRGDTHKGLAFSRRACDPSSLGASVSRAGPGGKPLHSCGGTNEQHATSQKSSQTQLGFFIREYLPALKRTVASLGKLFILVVVDL